MNSTPLVSIIVPIYNAEKDLECSLRALLAQTLKETQIIIVNDASTDRSEDVAKKFAESDNRIVYIPLSENCGAHEARLKGISVAEGSWIGFLDADDACQNNMFESMVCAGESHNVDIVICGSYRVGSRGYPLKPRVSFSKNEKHQTEVFKKFCNFQFGSGALWNKLYRKEILQPYANLTFPWRQDINEDLLLNIGAFYNARSVYTMRSILHLYTSHPKSVTGSLTTVSAYVQTFRAFACAIQVFSCFGPNAINHITNLYRKQLNGNDYRVSDVRELVAYEHELNEAISLIYKTHSVALANLSSRSIVKTHNSKSIAVALMRRLLNIYTKVIFLLKF